MAGIQAFYTLEVKDKSGKTVSKITKPCRSFVIAFLKLIESLSDPSVSVSIKDTAGATQTIDEDDRNLHCFAGGTVTTYGQVVGTGTTPVASDDYVMEALIAHGVGAGQLSYGATSKVTTAEVGANVDFQIIRTFTNSSGGTINVTEIGIGGRGMGFYFLILHEIVALTAVPNGQTLTMTITYRTTV